MMGVGIDAEMGFDAAVAARLGRPPLAPAQIHVELARRQRHGRTFVETRRARFRAVHGEGRDAGAVRGVRLDAFQREAPKR
jgi:hypothetical protein